MLDGVHVHAGSGGPFSIGIVLGASRFPHHPQVDSSKLGAAFRSSYTAVLRYLYAQSAVVFDAFDCEALPDNLCLALAEFLAEHRDATDVIVYYVGHGRFSSNQDYRLALACTRAKKPDLTSLAAAELADVLVSDMPKRARCYLILDCCFAGAAVPFLMQGNESDLLAAKLQRLPRGVSLLVAASKENAAVVPRDAEYTMFCESLLAVLEYGSASHAEALSLRDVGSLVEARIRDRYRDEAVLPQVHSPVQRDGDPADHPIFPNRAHAPHVEHPPPPPRRTPPSGAPPAPAPPVVGTFVTALGWAAGLALLEFRVLKVTSIPVSVSGALSLLLGALILLRHFTPSMLSLRSCGALVGIATTIWGAVAIGVMFSTLPASTFLPLVAVLLGCYAVIARLARTEEFERLVEKPPRGEE